MLCICGSAHAGEQLLELHGPDGQRAYVAPRQIASLRTPTAFDLQRHFAAGTKCIVLTTDGKFVAVVETCAAIRELMR